jgi:hypothetical protein
VHLVTTLNENFDSKYMEQIIFEKLTIQFTILTAVSQNSLASTVTKLGTGQPMIPAKVGDFYPLQSM